MGEPQDGQRVALVEALEANGSEMANGWLADRLIEALAAKGLVIVERADDRHIRREESRG